MCKCENVKIWKCENVKIWECENVEMLNCDRLSRQSRQSFSYFHIFTFPSFFPQKKYSIRTCKFRLKIL